MFRNYLIIALRNMRRYKLYTSINLAGLAVGIACCLMIGLLIQDELKYDRFHKHADRIYRFSNWPTMAKANAHLGPKFVTDFPEIEQATRIYPLQRTLIEYQDKIIYEYDLLYAESNFFDVFSFSLSKGDPKTALTTPNAFVISQEMAKRYFGDEDPIGKTVLAKTHTPFTLTITGVLDDLPHHSHFTFQGLVSYKNYQVGNREMAGAYTYLLLAEQANQQQLTEKIRAWHPHQLTPPANMAPDAPRPQKPFRLMALTDIHLRSHFEDELGANWDINELYQFSAVGILVLLIACVNYMNLATARSANRAKEVGLRKVVGANRKQLIRQFLGESLFTTALAFIVAIALAELFLPLLNASVGRSLTMNYDNQFFLILGASALLIGILAGSYPAFFLSHFRPIAILSGHSGSTPKSASFRKGLVVIQFAISIGLISATGVVMWQLQFIKNKNLGFDKRNVVLLDTEGIKRQNTTGKRPATITEYQQATEKRFHTIKEELLRNPNILSVSLASVAPGQDFWGGNTYTLLDKPNREPTYLKTMYIDQYYLKTLGLDLIEGQNFQSIFASESHNGIILNESAARKLGINKTVGQKVNMHMSIFEDTGTVMGIVRDFHIQSLHHKIEPLALRLHIKPGYIWNAIHFAIKIHPNAIPETLTFLKEKWADLAPTQHFHYTFLDTYFNFDQLYQKETRLMRVFGAFSLLTIFVAFLGLFGLASFTAESRTKEIGIRKVFGASVTNIITLLSKDFVKLMIIANLIAWPTAYHITHNWLQNFAYRITLGWEIFVLSGTLALALALLTVGWQAVRAAHANPVDTLRVE